MEPGSLCSPDPDGHKRRVEKVRIFLIFRSVSPRI